MLTRATLRDSGNYTCVPTGAISASVQVHVLNGRFHSHQDCQPSFTKLPISFPPPSGEHPAAMQTSSGVPCPTHQALILLFVSLNSCNFSELIYSISNLLGATRFLLSAVSAGILVRFRRFTLPVSIVLLALVSICTALRTRTTSPSTIQSDSFTHRTRQSARDESAKIPSQVR